jgi:hypothetical protein
MSLLTFFPESVVIENVSIALSALLGNPVRTMALDDGTVCAHRAGAVEYTSLPATIFMVTICARDIRGENHSCQYFFECTDGGRMLTMGSTPLNLAIARRLVDLFGGRMIYSDREEWSLRKPDYKRPAFRHNNAGDNPGFSEMQKRLLAITPISTDEIRACEPYAEYKDLVPGFENPQHHVL